MTGLVKLIWITVSITTTTLSRDFLRGDKGRAWTDADSYCMSTYGTHLASIHNEQEYNAVNVFCGGHCWIGANDRSNEGTYRWSDNTVYAYTHYHSGEPNNANGNEDCIWSMRGWGWNDDICSKTYSFVCNGLSDTNCEEEGSIKHINWNQLQNAENNSAQTPYSSFTISLDQNTLELTFNIDLEYIGNSADGNFDNEYNLGTTYVVDFESFGSYGNLINNPGNCQNRVSESFNAITDFNEYWKYSDFPHQDGHLGSDSYLSYPPPSDYWTLSIDNTIPCAPINYEGIFSWKDLSECKDFAGNNLIEIKDDGISITLSGTLYVNMVSPYSMDTTDNGMYRAFPLIQQDFEISILKQINVLSSTGVELFITSIIGIFEDETDGSFELSILTQSADYIQLINPSVLSSPFGSVSGVSISSVTVSCLVASTYTCGQIFTIHISSQNVNCPPADFSGIYSMSFDVDCRFEETVCDTFIENNGDSSTIALQVESNFIDTYCEPEIYSIIFDGNMKFYHDSQFSIQHSELNDNYIIGQDTIYVEITVNFPENGNIDNYYNVFKAEIENVFVCTANDTVNMTQHLNQQNGVGGCLSLNTAIDIDGPYDIIVNGNPTNYDANIILSQPETNIVRFSFLTFDIGRTKMYVHTQLILTLINGERRRLELLSGNVESETQTSNQVRHFIDSTTIIHNEEINVFSTKYNENTDRVSNIWMQFIPLSVFVSSIISYVIIA